MVLLLAFAATSLAIWVWLLLGRHGFWRARPLLEDEPVVVPRSWPPVAAIVPARDEVAVVGRALTSLLHQDYPGPLTVTLVDDHSEDDTRAIAESLRSTAPPGRPLAIVAAPPLPAGWAGKVHAVATGLADAARRPSPPTYLLLTDADIVHAPDGLCRLVAKAEAGALDLVSVMVRLHCRSLWERLLIPPFVFFFRKLYPFAAVGDPRRRTAAAAGGCMLVRSEALAAAGGIETIRGALIDDVALARAIKHRPGGGRLWLGLATTTESIRPYHGLDEIWRMVARSADTQLRHSLLLLLGTVLGMALAYLVPPFAMLLGLVAADGPLAGLGALAWLAMTIACWPTVRLYRLSPAWALTLPVAAALYVAMTIDSAVRHRLGVGGAWKGRVRPHPDRA